MKQEVTKVSRSKALEKRTQFPTELLDRLDPKVLKKLMTSFMMNGDLANFEEEEQAVIYLMFCKRLDLDPFTKPFDRIVAGDKLILYANKSCTSQLGERHKVSLVSQKTSTVSTVFVVDIVIQDIEGRRGPGTGAVDLANKIGENLGNAMKKAHTQAWRRAVLNLYGLGMLDISENGALPGNPDPLPPLEISEMPESLTKKTAKRKKDA